MFPEKNRCLEKGGRTLSATVVYSNQTDNRDEMIRSDGWLSLAGGWTTLPASLQGGSGHRQVVVRRGDEVVGDITVDPSGMVQSMNCRSEESFGPVLQAGVREMGPLTAQVKFQDLPQFIESGFEPVGISEDKTIMTLRSGDPADRDGLQASVFAGGMTLVANVVDDSDSDSGGELRAGAGCGCSGGTGDDSVTTVEALLVDNNTNQTLDIFDIHVAPDASRPGGLAATVESVGSLQGGGDYDHETAHAMIRRLLAQSGVSAVSFDGEPDDEPDDEPDVEDDSSAADPDALEGGEGEGTPDIYNTANKSFATAFQALNVIAKKGSNREFDEMKSLIQQQQANVRSAIQALVPKIRDANEKRRRKELEARKASMEKLDDKVTRSLARSEEIRARNANAPKSRIDTSTALKLVTITPDEQNDTIDIQIRVDKAGDLVLRHELRRGIDTAVQRFLRRNSGVRRPYIGYKRNPSERKPGNSKWFLSNIQRSFPYKDPSDPTGKKTKQISKAFTLTPDRIETLGIPQHLRTDMFLSAVADYLADIMLHNQVVETTMKGESKAVAVDLQSPYFQEAAKLKDVPLKEKDHPSYMIAQQLNLSITDKSGRERNAPVSALKLRPIELAYSEMNGVDAVASIMVLRGDMLEDKILLREEVQGPRQRRNSRASRPRKPRAAAETLLDSVGRQVQEFNLTNKTVDAAANLGNDWDAPENPARDAAPAPAPAPAPIAIKGLSKKELVEAVPSRVPGLDGTPDRAAQEVPAPREGSNLRSVDDLMNLINAATVPEAPKPSRSKPRRTPTSDGVKTRSSGIRTRSRSRKTKEGLRGGAVDDTMSVMSYDDAIMSVLLE